MTWRIPHVEIGDKVRLINDAKRPRRDELEEGAVLTVVDVGERYGLPFVRPENYDHDIQLQPRSYEKVEGST